MPSEKSCGIVLFREELPQRLYLLLHYEEGHWDFAKGHVEEGENETAAAFREVKEETGISDAELVFGFRERIEYIYKKGDEAVHKEVYFFLGRTSTPDVLLSHEHVAYEWLPYEKAIERLTYKNAQDILKKAEKTLNRWGEGKI